MAPEQWNGGPLDERTDQFAFCASLYEALHGVRPFVGESLPELAARITAGERNPAAGRGDLSPGLARAIERGLAARPEDRHASMQVLLDALAQARPGPSPRPRRRRSVALAAGALLLALAATLVVLTLRARPAATDAAGRLRMQIVDTDSEWSTKLGEFVDGDAEAKRLGVAKTMIMWDLPAGHATTTEHYVRAARREDLEAYLAALPGRRADLAPERGHELVIGRDEARWRTYYVWKRVELDGSSIREATAMNEPGTGRPVVRVSFDEPGAARFAGLTGQNVGRHLVVIADGEVTQSPVIMGPILGGIVDLTVSAPKGEDPARVAADLARSLRPRR
jgi:hypothetical protein